MKINLIALKRLADREIYQPNDGCTNLSYLLERLGSNNESLTIDEIEAQLIQWLDSNCHLGDSWTNHGSWIWLSWERVRAKLEGMGF